MATNPGQTMSIYNIPSIVRQSLPLAVSPRNISSGFSCTGISPFNRDIFGEIDYAPSTVTDRPAPDVQPAETAQVHPAEPSVQNTGETPDVASQPSTSTAGMSEIASQPSTSTGATTVASQPSTSAETSDEESQESSSTAEGTSTSTSTAFSPEQVRPFPKAPPRKTKTGGRKRRTTQILTDTPVKNTITEEKMKARAKKNKVKRSLNSQPAPKKKRQPAVKKMQQEESSASEDLDDEENICLVCCEHYRNSRPGEKWVQCVSCHLWAHEDCTSGDNNYVCQNCDSCDSE